MKIYLFIFPLFIFGCAKPNRTTDIKKLLKYDSSILGKIVGDDFLKITADFDECGEFGGHHEEFKIYKEKNIYYAEFIKDFVDCNSENPNREIVKQNKFILSDKDQKVVVKYLHQLLDKSLQAEVPYHAGRFYSVMTKNSSFTMRYHDFGSNWKLYEKFKQHLRQ